MKKNLLFCIALLLMFGGMAQKPQLPLFVRDSLDSHIKQRMTEWNIPGMAVAIVKDGQVVWLKGYGVKKAGGTDRVDENTLFMIASNTKLFTATALAILQEEGKLKLDDKVVKWMPEFRLKDTLATREVNITDLLSHRIGFETFQGDFTNWGTNLTSAEILRNMAVIDPVYSFRLKYGYCNAAFLAAGEIIPRATGKSWEATVREKILMPLGMNSTLILSGDFPKAANIALPHSLVDGKLTVLPIVLIDNLAPATSMCSNISDLSKWVKAQLALGMVNDTQRIAKKAIQATRIPQSIIRVDQRDKQFSHFALYGSGVGISDRGGKLVFSHNGGADGFVTAVMMIPEEQLGIVVLTNTDQNRFYQDLAFEIRDAFLGIPFQDISGKSLQRYLKEQQKATANLDSLRAIIKMNNATSLPLTEFAGTYVNKVYGTIRLEKEKEGLIARFEHHPGATATLQHIKNDTFLCTYSYTTLGVKEIPFKLEDGKVKGFTLYVDDFVEFLPYEFTRQE